MSSTLVRRLWKAGLVEGRALLGHDLETGIARNSLVTLASSVAGMALGLASSAWLARGLGPEGLSLFAVLSTVTVIGHTVSDLGLSRGAISQVAAALGSAPDQARHTAAAFAQLKLAAALVSGMGLMAFSGPLVGALNLPEDTGRLLLGVTSLMLLVTAVHGISGTLLQSLQRFQALALTQLVNAGLTVLGVGALFYLSRLSIWSALLAAGIFSTLAATGLEFLWLPAGWRRALFLLARERLTEARRLLRFSRWLWLSGALSILSTQLDLLLLNRWAAPVEVGLYALAFNLSFKAHVVNKTLYTVLLPAASSLQDAASFRSFLRRSLARSMLWGALMVLALPFARPFIQVVYGSEYAASVGVFYLLMAFVLFDLLALPLFLLAFSMKQPGLVAASDAVRVAVLVAGSTLLIPVWGMYGAAAAKLISIAAGALVTGIAVTAALRKLP